MVLTLILAAFPAQNPNSPGILDPVVQHYLQTEVRLPGSDQVLPPSELVNIVGGTRRRPAPGSQSATGATITQSGTESPNRDLRTALNEMERASASGDTTGTLAWSQEALDILHGTTQGRIYDGFAMLHYDRGAWLTEHVPGEYLTKRVRDSGRRAAGPGGRPQVIWTVDVNLLFYDDEVDGDTAFLLFPPEVHPLDHLIVNWRIYSSEHDDFIPTTLLDDFDPFGAGLLPSKGYDATWIVVNADERVEVAVKQGSLGNLRGLQVWRWRTPRPGAHFIQPVFEHVSPVSGLVTRDARGAALMELRRGHGADRIGDAAPEQKIRQVADAALAGASPATIQAMLNDPLTPPFGVWSEWADTLESKDDLPPETWMALAQEGITEGMADPLGPYDVVMAWANHELYVVADDEVVRDPQTGLPIPGAGDYQNARLNVKVFNHDLADHYLQVADYGPPLHDDIATCDNAPGGDHSLEIFNEKPVFGAPKILELQWRAGFALRRGLGILEPFDMFPRLEDQGALAGFTDPWGGARLGWSWPSDLRGGDFVVAVPPAWLGTAAGLSEPGFATGLRIGATTPGFGSAKMPAGDLAAFHPDGLVNTDTDGDLVEDALIFPDWLRNPHAAGGDAIPTTPDFAPFLWLSPENGTPWQDPANPAAGPWAARTFALGFPVTADSAQSFTMVRPRFSGQGLWYADGLWRDLGVGVTHHHENGY
jgi:hypothetical protein